MGCMDELVRNMDMIHYEYLVYYGDWIGGYCIIVCVFAGKDAAFCSVMFCYALVLGVFVLCCCSFTQLERGEYLIPGSGVGCVRAEYFGVSSEAGRENMLEMGRKDRMARV